MFHAPSRWFTLMVVPLLLLGCKADSSAGLTARVESLTRDVDGLRGRVATLEKQVDAMKLAEAKSEEQLADASRRLRSMESTLLRVGIEPSIEVPPPVSASVPTYQPAPHSRSTASASAASTSSPSAGQTYSPAPATQAAPPRAIVPAKPAFDEESYRQSNNFFGLEDRAKSFCNQKWPNDADMATYCFGKQLSAAQALDRGRPFGANPDVFKAKRANCFKKWGSDFEMRLYCEGH